jgi:glycosyltransferase involved in cell wall biosynthesis
MYTRFSNNLETLMKKLLIILPVYNEEKLVERAINSILNQTFQNFELYIINDCSTDNSLLKIKQYLDNDKVKLINNTQNGGCFYSKNTGIQLMEKQNFDVYTTHDADDFSDSTRFEKIMNFFDNDNLLALQDTQIKIGNVAPEWHSKPGDVIYNHAHAFFSKKAFSIFGYLDNVLCGADTEYWHRVLKYVSINNKYKIKNFDELLYYAQVTDDNMIIRYGSDIRDQYFKEHINKTSNMIKDKDFYKPFFSIEKAIK